MIIQDIYNQYHIPPHLQLHMLRVAGVMKLLSQNRKGDEDLNRDVLISAALLHDMGNIVKFTFDEYTMPLFQGTDIEEQKIIHKNMVEKYGRDDHAANIAICKELGMSDTMIRYIDALEFNNLNTLAFAENPAEILMIYTDLRVGPFGILSVYDRLKEAALRYNKKNRSEKLEKSAALAGSHEEQIFLSCSINPEGITDETINPLIEDLRKTTIL